MKEWLLKILDIALDLIFPKSEEVLYLEKALTKGKTDFLPKSTRVKSSFINSLFDYRDRKVRTLVWAIKYKQNPILIKEIGKIFYEEILNDLGEDFLFENHNKILVLPAPSSNNRYREKGFNQTEDLVNAIKAADTEGNFEYPKGLVIKSRETATQTSLHRSKRLQNLLDAFEVTDDDVVKGATIIVIDDVTTTGSTLNEIRKALRDAGARKILAWTIAH